MATKKELFAWSNVAYDLADAVMELLFNGQDGPAENYNSHLSDCSCNVHLAINNWGIAQLALLNKYNPGWEDELYGREQTD